MNQSQKLFGTDGVRGRVNEYPMTPEVALRLGLAAGNIFRNGQRRHKVIIGKDTRLSGYVFEAALTSGLCAAGMDVFQVGPMPTPAISFLTQSMRCDLGVVISASHNPYYDNGIKFFDNSGFKLADAVERELEELVFSDDGLKFPESHRVGKAQKIEDSRGRYIVALKNTFPKELSLEGIRVVLDCANGAAYSVAPTTLEELGAEVFKMGVSPDGLNINADCGALHPKALAQKVLETRADIGLALDGDADRLIVVDEKGQVLDGDQIMALCAKDLMERGQLRGNLLVSTVMSNMALEVFMKDMGGRLIRTPVGDRHVAEALRAQNGALGGEQSGHIIFSDFATTGDGLLAALQMLSIMVSKQAPLSSLAQLLTPFPHLLKNVGVTNKVPLEDVEPVMKAIQAAEQRLDGRGRVLVRYSGTEPIARVMVEGEDMAVVETLCDDIVCVIQESLS